MNERYRLDFFKTRINHPRMWWFALNDYLPPIYAALEDDEFDLLAAWFEETERQKLIGECNVPAISELLGFITGNGIDSIVQCGHYSGYSTLLMGFALRRMGRKNALFSIDIDASVTDFTQSWVKRAGLQDVVRLQVGDSADVRFPSKAKKYFGAAPKAIFIDSSHQYAHTLAELDLWFQALRPGGLIFLHDVSDFARSFDTTHSGGVGAALIRWRVGKMPETILHIADVPETIMLSLRSPQIQSKENPLHDGCGLGIIQK